mmetsp:Transcript_20514/g.48248  ORF Transcript_20514/g.48248 Transcript_20514/m.48248 type:complete len:368 (-) Transcript_20514:282-1385(-)
MLRGFLRIVVVVVVVDVLGVPLAAAATAAAVAFAEADDEQTDRREGGDGDGQDGQQGDGPRGQETRTLDVRVLDVRLGGNELPVGVDDREPRRRGFPVLLRDSVAAVAVCVVAVEEGRGGVAGVVLRVELRIEIRGGGAVAVGGEEAGVGLLVVALVLFLPPDLLESLGSAAAVLVEPVVGWVLDVVVLVVTLGGPEDGSREDRRRDVGRVPVVVVEEDGLQHVLRYRTLLLGGVEDRRVIARSPVAELPRPVEGVHVPVGVADEDLVARLGRVVLDQDHLVVTRMVPVGRILVDPPGVSAHGLDDPRGVLLEGLLGAPEASQRDHQGSVSLGDGVVVADDCGCCGGTQYYQKHQERRREPKHGFGT